MTVDLEKKMYIKNEHDQWEEDNNTNKEIIEQVFLCNIPVMLRSN